MGYRTQQGFTLPEVLASVFLLAVGIVGAAGMQVHALRTTQQSALHTAALALATEMADTMRMTLTSDRSQALLEAYLQVDFRAGEPETSAAPDCYRLACGTEQLVAFSIDEWTRRLDVSLPDARAKICFDAHSGDSAPGPLDWACRPPAVRKESERGALIVKIGWRDKTQPSAQEMQERDREAPPRLVLTVAPYAQ